MERFRVREWLDDAPYPRAVVDVCAEAAPPAGSDTAVNAAASARRRLMALAIEMGAQGQQLEIDLPDDPAAAAWVLCAAAPVGSLDRQRLLEVDDVVERLTLLATMLTEQAEDLARLLQES
jgi:Lon protease-like protein